MQRYDTDHDSYVPMLALEIDIAVMVGADQADLAARQEAFQHDVLRAVSRYRKGDENIIVTAAFFRPLYLANRTAMFLAAKQQAYDASDALWAQEAKGLLIEAARPPHEDTDMPDNEPSDDWESKLAHAPWTEDQVASLNAYQADPPFHPYTCFFDGGIQHGDLGSETRLVAHADGWHCPECSYTQDWAQSSLADWRWQLGSDCNKAIIALFGAGIRVSDDLSAALLRNAQENWDRLHGKAGD
jgi:hypothetical protein